MSLQPITGLVLAGGRGSRLGGLDKGLVEWRGRPLVAYAIERLAPQVNALLLSANRNRQRYEGFGHPVVTDAVGDYRGPLAGLQAGLAACTTPLLVTVACDAPHLPVDLVAKLALALDAAKAALAVASTNDGLQPTFLLCRRTVAPSLDAWLAGDNRKVADWLREMNAEVVAFADNSAFANFNSPSDLA